MNKINYIFIFILLSTTSCTATQNDFLGKALKTTLAIGAVAGSVALAHQQQKAETKAALANERAAAYRAYANRPIIIQRPQVYTPQVRMPRTVNCNSHSIGTSVYTNCREY